MSQNSRIAPDNTHDDDSWEVVSLPEQTEPDVPSEQGTGFSFALDLGSFAKLSLDVRSTPKPTTADMSNARTVPNIRPDAKDRPLADQSQSRLLSLPPEIRHQIYELVLYIPHDLHEGVRIMPDTLKAPRPRPSVLALTATCRQINVEAETLFYSMNRLSLASPDGQRTAAVIAGFWQVTNKHRLEAIKAYTMPVASGENLYSLLLGLQDAPNLESLHIKRLQKITYVNFRTWRVMIPQIVDELRKFKNLREITIFTPGWHEFEADHILRMMKKDLDKIDGRIRAAVQVPDDAARTQLKA